MATFISETEHGGARLAVEIVENESARLLINGIERETTGDGRILKLTSTVQTDYEWHEFIEADIRYHDTTVEVVLTGNKKELKREVFPRTAT